MYGAVVLFWMGLEDRGTLTVALLGWAGSAVAIGYSLLRQYAGVTVTRGQLLGAGVVVGALVGVGAVLATVLLMFFKTSWHGHLFPDYPTTMMLAMFDRWLAWGGAGAALGVALVLVIYSTRVRGARD